MIDWRHWHNEPWLVGGLVLAGWLWAILAGPLRARLAPAAPFPRGHAVKFYLGLLFFYLAVGSPLDQIAERFLFSAHMLQHQLLVYPAAILFLLGLPDWMIDPLLGQPALRRIVRLLTHPVVCGLIYSIVISGWHAPWLYDWALRVKLVHIIEHLTFFGAALLYWWPMLSPSRIFLPISWAAQLLYIIAVVIGMTPIFAYITFTSGVLYPTYEYAPRLWSEFSAADDQLLAGVMMKIIGMFVSLGAFIRAFYRWYRENK